MPSGQLDSGTVAVRDRRTAEVIGYAFSEPNATGQLQRWLLFRHPGNDFEISAPPLGMDAWGLAEWKANVAGLWQRGSYYVRAQSDIYEFGRAYDGRVWDTLPADYLLPAPTYPAGGDGFQLDHRGMLIDILSPERRALGSVFVTGSLDDASNAEYWLLLPGYSPAGQRAPASITDGTTAAADLASFVTIANRSWTTGASLAITGCKNYKGDVPPALL